jgi:hypothetical protein
VFVSTNAASNVTGGIGISARTTGAGVDIETHGTVTGTGAGGAPAGDAIQVVQTGTGAVTVHTFGNVAGNAAALGGDAINISGGGTGPVLVRTFTAVTGDPAIIINMGWAGTDRHRRILADHGEWSGSNQRHLDREHRTGRRLCERDQHRHGGQRHLHQHHGGGSRARHGQHGYGRKSP